MRSNNLFFNLPKVFVMLKNRTEGYQNRIWFKSSFHTKQGNSQAFIPGQDIPCDGNKQNDADAAGGHQDGRNQGGESRAYGKSQANKIV